MKKTTLLIDTPTREGKIWNLLISRFFLFFSSFFLAVLHF